MLEKIDSDLKQAMLAGDKLRVSVLRGLKSVLKNASIDKRDDLTEEEITAVLKTAAKQRRESIEAYKAGGADDKAQQEEQELKIIENYLPQPMAESEIKEVAARVVTDLKASSPQDIGRVIGETVKRCQGRADSALIAQIVKNILTS